jgi:hypothetical protein
MQPFFAILLIIIGVVALITPFTPGSWLALIGLGMMLKKTPQEVLEMLKEKLKYFRRKK